MADCDLERAILQDRLTPLPGEPDINATLEAVRRRVSLEKRRSATPRLREGPPQLRGVIGLSGIATALGIAALLSGSGSRYLLFIIPLVELVALKTLIREEFRP